MFIFTVIAVLLASLIIAYKEELKPCETVWPVCIVMILMLYILAFFRFMWIIDYISIVFSGIMLIWILKNNLYKEIFAKLITPQNLAIVIVMIIAFIWQKSFNVDLTGENLFYASDLKSLYELNGFAKAYGTVIPAYGDYPPGMQLFEWFFLHMSPKKYSEGLGIVGYTFLNLILLMPLLGRIRFIKKADTEDEPEDTEVDVRVTENKKYRFVYESYHVKSKYKVHIYGDRESKKETAPILEWTVLLAINLIVCMSLILIPTVVSNLELCIALPDVTLGISYGMLILSALDSDRVSHIYYLKILLYGCLILLLRTWGILWLIPAVIICIIRIKNERDYVEDIRYLIIVPALWLIEAASWVTLCILMHRHSELTAYMLRAFSGKTGMITEFSHKLLEFIKALMISPILAYRIGLIRLSPLITLILFILIIRLFNKKGTLDDKAKKILSVHAIVMFIVVYGFIFFQYLHIWESPQMTITQTVERYGIPYMLSLLIILFGLFIKLCDSEDMEVALREDNVDRQVNNMAAKAVYVVYGILVAFILLSADYSFVSKDTATESDSSVSLSVPGADQFIKEADAHVELRGRRVLYLTDDSIDKKTKDALSYELSPVAVVYAQITDDFNAEALNSAIANSEAQFVYCDIYGENITSVLSDMCEETWENGRVYQIRADGTLGYIDL